MKERGLCDIINQKGNVLKSVPRIYRPITATPFLNDETYCEIAPCEALNPYIRCFWGAKKTLVSLCKNEEFGLVIPDTCMDIRQEIIFSKGFDVLDAVKKYGFTDQSHLLNDFKRRHLMLPREAAVFARKMV